MHQRGTFREEATKRDIQLANALGHQISHTANSFAVVRYWLVAVSVVSSLALIGITGRVFGWW